MRACCWPASTADVLTCESCVSCPCNCCGGSCLTATLLADLLRCLSALCWRVSDAVLLLPDAAAAEGLHLCREHAPVMQAVAGTHSEAPGQGACGLRKAMLTVRVCCTWLGVLEQGERLFNIENTALTNWRPVANNSRCVAPRITVLNRSSVVSSLIQSEGDV
jgi:hypothetical protein